MTARLITSCLLLAAGASAQLATTKVGGIQADLLSLGLKNGIVTASVKLTNTNKDQTAYVLAMGSPSGVDNDGGKFNGTGFNQQDALTGMAYCVGPPVNPPEPRRCVGSPKVDENLFPPEQYTEIEPDNSVTIQLHLATPGAAGKSDKVSLSIPVVYRLVKTADVPKDGDTPQSAKLKALHFSSIGFPPTQANQETNATIKY